MKIFKIVIFTLFFSVLLLQGQERVRLEGLAKPETFVVDDKNIYVADGASVYIFSKADYSLKRKFGAKGEGPQEFTLFRDRGLRLYLKGEFIVVNSVMKLSFWTKDGEFVRSVKPQKFAALYVPVGDAYAGSGRLVKDKVRYKTVNLYNSDLEPVREIMRSKEVYQPGKGLDVGGDNCFVFEAGGGMIFCCNSQDFEIKVFDDSGVKIRDIKRDYKKLKVTPEFRRLVINHLKTDPKFKNIYHMLKPIGFGNCFHVIEALRYDDGKLFAVCSSDNDEQVVVVLRPDGRLLGQLKLPLYYKDALKNLCPFVIKGEKVYQIVEDEDDEAWDLVIFDLKL